MLYAILCYNTEEIVTGWTQAEDDAVMASLDKVHQKLMDEGRFGPAIRLMPTTAATSLRREEGLVLDGPFVETKEQLLGFYIVDCKDLEEALDTARALTKANPASGGGYEVRPLRLFLPGVPGIGAS
ncbi:MAG: YciI family protein [Pseudomonadota bacterium]